MAYFITIIATYDTFDKETPLPLQGFEQEAMSS